MYDYRNQLLIGFHGCDKEVRDHLVNTPFDQNISISRNPYDWLGHVFYVWENNYERALEWASRKKDPAVLGVIFSLGKCFDLMDSAFIKKLPLFHKKLINDLNNLGQPLPTNKNIKADKYNDLLIPI